MFIWTVTQKNYQNFSAFPAPSTCTCLSEGHPQAAKTRFAYMHRVCVQSQKFLGFYSPRGGCYVLLVRGYKY